MKAIQITDKKKSSNLIIVDIEKPELTDDTLLIKVQAAGVNFADVMQQQGLYPRVIPSPYTPGYEVAGEVVAAGNNVTGFMVGDRVAAFLLMGGGFAEYARVHPQQCFVLPPALGFKEATALLTQGLTAFIMVEKFIEKGQSALITAAAGGVGNIALQLAALKGAAPLYGAAGSVSKMALIEKLGATAIDYRQPDWEKICANEGMSVDVLLDAVGGETLTEAWTLLKDFGSLVNYGNASFTDLTISPQQLAQFHFKNQSLHFYGFSSCLAHDPSLLQKGLQQLMEATITGKLSIPLHPSYRLDSAQQALTDLVNRNTQGKVIIEP